VRHQGIVDRTATVGAVCDRSGCVRRSELPDRGKNADRSLSLIVRGTGDATITAKSAKYSTYSDGPTIAAFAALADWG